MKVYVVTWDEAVRFDLPYIKYSLNSRNRFFRRLRIDIDRNEGEEEVLLKWLDTIYDFLMEDDHTGTPIKEIDFTVQVSFSGWSSTPEDRAAGIIR